MKKNYLFSLLALGFTSVGLIAASQSGQWSPNTATDPAPTRTDAPAADPEVVTFYGALDQSPLNPDWNDSQKYGIYSFTNTDKNDLKAVGPVGTNRAQGGGFYHDGYFYFVQGSSANTGSYVENSFIKMNLETWKVEERTMHVTPTKTNSTTITFDYITNTAYAACPTLNSTQPYMLRTVNLSNGEMTDVAPLPANFTALACDGNGQLWGVAREDNTYTATLHKIDKTSGKTNVIGDLGYKQRSQNAAATFDLRTGKLYWTTLTVTINNMQEETYKSYLMEIDLSTGKATPVKTFEYDEVFTALYLKDCHPLAPEAVTDLEFVYADDNNSGKVKFTVPSRAYNRTSLSGNVKVEILLDGKSAGTKDGVTPGSVFESQNISLTPGEHKIKVICYNAAGNKGIVNSLDVWGGIDVPAKVSDIQLSVTRRGDTAEVTWKAPETGKGNGRFDKESLTYTVIRRPEGKTVAEGLKECKFTDTPERGMLLSQYEIYAVTKDGKSDPAYSAPKLIGAPYTATYMETFDTPTDFNKYTTISVNGVASPDGDAFMYYPNYKEAVYWLNYSYYNSADAWLITPTLALDPEKAYTVSFQTHGYSQNPGTLNWGQTNFEIAIGNDATQEAMSRVLHSEDFISELAPRTIRTIFVPKQDDCRIGFHLRNNGNDHAAVDNIRVAEYGVATIPGVPGNISAYKDNGTIKVKATVPSVNAKGEKISSVSSIELFRPGYSTPISKIDNPAVGKEIELSDTDPVYDDNTYIVCARNEHGIGLEGSVTINAKPDVPQSVTDMEVKTDNSGKDAVISWEYPSDMLGANGEKLKATDITYSLYRIVGIDRTLVADGLTETSYAIYDIMSDFPGERQKRIEYEVVARTDGGEANGVKAGGVFGIAYELPIEYQFDGSTMKPWEMTGEWAGFSIASTGYDPRVTPLTGNTLLTFYCSKDSNGWARYVSPRINLTSLLKPELTFTMYQEEFAGYNNATVKIGILPEVDGVAGEIEYFETLYRPYGEKGWKEFTVDLSKYADCTRASVVIYASNNNRRASIHFDNIKISGEKPDYDASVTTIAGPDNAVMGRQNTYNVNVANNGKNDLEKVEVAFKLDDVTLETKSVMLNEGESLNIPFNYTPGLDEQGRKAIISAEITTEKDGNLANNEAIMRINVVAPNLPYVTDLQAMADGNNVRLSWSDASKYPNAQYEVDDIESYDNFLIDNIGNWTVYDGDGATTMRGISSSLGTFEWENAGLPQAFIVFNPEKVGVKALCTAHSGQKCFVSFAGAQQNNDWLISPALLGEEQTLSFYTRAMLSGTAEVYDVMVSSTGTSIEDFTPIATDITIKSIDWTKKSYTLPEGTRHFAIVCKSSNQFGFMLDDFEFIPEQPAVELTGYNVYRDGDLLVSGLGETEHLDSDNVEYTKDYRYHVTATYTDGESVYSNPADINLSGINGVSADGIRVYASTGRIVVAGAQDQHIGVYTLDGRCVYSFTAKADTESLNVAAGIYVVRAGKTTVKVMVK